MNSSFEEMWNCMSSPENESSEMSSVFASMEPYRVGFETPTGTDIQMITAYKAVHSYNVIEAPNDMHMVKTKTICRKCLLHTKVCRLFGHNLKKYEIEVHMAKKIRNKMGSS